MAICLNKLTYYDEAINICNLYLNKFRLNFKIIEVKCESIFNKGLIASAIIELENYINIEPSWFQLYTILGDYYRKNKQYDNAEKAF